MKVPLDDAGVCGRELHVPSQENTFSLSPCLRLDDKGYFLALASHIGELLPKLGLVRGQQPCFWLKVLQERHYLLHSHDVASQIVLPRQKAHTRNVVDLLIGFEQRKLLFGDGCVVPDDVELMQLLQEIFFWSVADNFVVIVITPGLDPRYPHLKRVLFADLANDAPLGVAQVDVRLLTLTRFLGEL